MRFKLLALALVCAVTANAHAERPYYNDQNPAPAYPAPYPAPSGAPANSAIPMSPLDCTVLSGTPYLCVRNPSHFSITGISCTGFWGTSPMSIPGGAIQSGGSAIVKFADKCQSTLKITRRDGSTFEMQGFDVKNNTTLNVQDN